MTNKTDFFFFSEWEKSSILYNVLQEGDQNYSSRKNYCEKMRVSFLKIS